MRTVLLVMLCLCWQVAALAQQQGRIRPDPELTPGDVFDVTKDDVCTPGYAKKVRAVPKLLRDRAFEEYGINFERREYYQLDHLIPLSLGGSNSVRNLWPQPKDASPWNAGAKDRLEAHLHKLVCIGRIDLGTAQHAFATDWITAYRRYVSDTPPVLKKHVAQHTGEITKCQEIKS